MNGEWMCAQIQMQFLFFFSFFLRFDAWDWECRQRYRAQTNISMNWLKQNKTKKKFVFGAMDNDETEKEI